MQELNILFPRIVSVLSLAAILIVLLFTILSLFRAAAFFTGRISVIMALSTSLLFIIGISQLLVVPGGMPNIAEVNPGTGVPVNYLLLSCLAPAVAADVVLSQVLLLASRIPPSENLPPGDPETHTQDTECSRVKSKPAGRPKKTEIGLSPAPQKIGRKEKNGVEAGAVAEGTTIT